MTAPRRTSTRRSFVLGAAAGAAALTGLTAGRARGAANGITTFRSPPLQKWAQDLPTLPGRSAAGDLHAGSGLHRFHPDLPIDRTWGYGGQSYLGPVLEAHRDEEVRIATTNQLPAHRFARDIDTSVHGCSAIDRTRPRHVLHLHGGFTEPASDGHPFASRRPGGTSEHRYSGRQEATALWYHDHSMGLTRLNVHAGLAGMYLLRDDHDTGRAGNRLGLPSGPQEVALVLQDKTFDNGGRMLVRTSTYVPEGQWEGGQAGDVATVNGAVWPQLDVDRTLYRLRLVNASNLRSYDLRFANGMRFFVVGNDGGLLDVPRQVEMVRIAASERLDLLVDFSGLREGETVVLQNTARLPFQFQIFGDPEIPEIMRFRGASRATRARSAPRRLRGARGLPPATPAPGRPVRVRNMTVNQLLDLRFPPARMNLNNLAFDTPDVDRPIAGTVEQWNLINLSTDEHPIHIHLATMRIIGRQQFDMLRFRLKHPQPPLGTRWTPSADDVTTSAMTGPDPWETGIKDTVFAPAGQVTRVLVTFPSAEELGFDPDATFPVPDTIAAGAPGMDRGGLNGLLGGSGHGGMDHGIATTGAPAEHGTMDHGAMGHGASAPGHGSPSTADHGATDHAGHGAAAARPAASSRSSTTGPRTEVVRLPETTQPAPDRCRGYVWHCHVIDHEDHEMMLPLRIGA